MEHQELLYNIIFVYEDVISSDLLEPISLQILHESSNIFFEILKKIYKSYEDDNNYSVKQFVRR